MQHWKWHSFFAFGSRAFYHLDLEIAVLYFDKSYSEGKLVKRECQNFWTTPKTLRDRRPWVTRAGVSNLSLHLQLQLCSRSEPLKMHKMPFVALFVPGGCMGMLNQQLVRTELHLFPRNDPSESCFCFTQYLCMSACMCVSYNLNQNVVLKRSKPCGHYSVQTGRSVSILTFPP